MSLLNDAFRRIGIGKITPKTGGIYRLSDSVISLPDGDLKKNRTKHDFRTVLVISNNIICSSLRCPCVTVAPMSHLLTSKAESDLVIAKSDSNGLDGDGRIMLGYVQPVLKYALEKEIGIL